MKTNLTSFTSSWQTVSNSASFNFDRVIEGWSYVEDVDGSIMIRVNSSFRVTLSGQLQLYSFSAWNPKKPIYLLIYYVKK